MKSHRSRHVLDGVTGGNFEQRMIGLGTLDSRKLICGFTETRIAVFAHDNHLEVWRSPHFGSNFDGLRIADLSGGNGDGGRSPRGRESAER